MRIASAACLALVLCATARPAPAQECTGLPGGRGVLSVGFEGTDGATGRGVGFAYQTTGGALSLHERSLDGFTLVDRLRSTEAQGSVRLLGALCAVAGAQWTAYDNDRLESESWTGDDPAYRTERILLRGSYARLRLPVGIGLGREFHAGEHLSLVPWVQPMLVWEREWYETERGPAELRSTLGWGVGGGITAAVDWLVLRAQVTHAATHGYALSGQHNWPTLSLHAGVRF